jgi:hypothetical protein
MAAKFQNEATARACACPHIGPPLDIESFSVELFWVMNRIGSRRVGSGSATSSYNAPTARILMPFGCDTCL